MGEFFRELKSRGRNGVKLIVGDKCPGILEVEGNVFPDAKYQRCTVHFYCNVFSVVSRFKMKLVSKRKPHEKKRKLWWPSRWK